MWADMAPVNGVPFIMRDVTLWAFTVPFFEEREDELRGVRGRRWPRCRCRSTRTSPSSASIQTHDTTRPDRPDRGADAGARRRGGHPHPGRALAALHERSPAPSGRPRRAATPAAGSTRPRSTRRCSSSGAVTDGPAPRPTQGGDVHTSFEGERRAAEDLADRFLTGAISRRAAVCPSRQAERGGGRRLGARRSPGGVRRQGGGRLDDRDGRHRCRSRAAS